MFVLCPHCQFLVAVDPASGLPPARCPRCDGAVLVDAAPALAGQAATSEQPPVEAELPTAPVDAPEPQPPETSASPAPEEAAVAAPAITASPGFPAGRRRNAPSFVRTHAPSAAPPTPRRRWTHLAVIAALSLVLALQILLADRAQLATDARWRPAIARLCGVLHCDLPPWREPSAFTLLDRNVVPDAATPNVLHITASFRNDARWTQPWPRLLLTLSDVDGRIAGARAFEPREYLARASRATTPTQNGLASGQSARVAMDIVEPAPRIVAFTFDFR